MTEWGEASGADAAGDPLEAMVDDVRRWRSLTCAALLREPTAPDASLDDVPALARGLRRHHRVFLLNLDRDGERLDERLGVGDRPGLAAVLRGDRKVGEATVRPPGERFLYLPAGADSDRPASDPAVADLVRRLRAKMEDAGWLLLVLVAPEDLGELGEDVVDARVLLDEEGPRWPPEAAPEPVWGAEEPGAGEAEPATETAVGERAGAASGEAGTAPTGEREPERSARETGPEDRGPQWRRHRRRAGPPAGRIVAGLVLVAALIVGWWWLAGRAGDAGEPAPGGSGPARESPADTASAVAGAEREAADGDTAPAEDAPAPAADVAAAAEELPYSVLVASYADAASGRERLEAWSDGELYFLAPTRVRGETYWRLYAGALSSREEAEALNGRLVRLGRKDTAGAWDVRPAALAFRAGIHRTRVEAARRLQTLRDAGVPGYLLRAVAEGDTVWQVYAGGYESERAAAPLRGLLREAGVEAELATRRGEATRP